MSMLECSRSVDWDLWIDGFPWIPRIENEPSSSRCVSRELSGRTSLGDAQLAMKIRVAQDECVAHQISQISQISQILDDIE